MFVVGNFCKAGGHCPGNFFLAWWSLVPVLGLRGKFYTLKKNYCFEPHINKVQFIHIKKLQVKQV